MAEKQFGVAVVWGISTTGYEKITGAAGVAYPFRTEEQTFRKTADVEETRSENGDYANICIYGGQEELSLRVYPSAATLAAANTGNVLPEIGSSMRVADIDVDIGKSPAGETQSPPDKQYIVMECSKARTGTTHVSFDVTLRRYGGLTNYVPIIT